MKTLLLLLSLNLVSCGDESGSVAISVTATSSPKPTTTGNINKPVPTTENTDSGEDSPSQDAVLDVPAVTASPTPSPTPVPTVDPIDYAFMAERKADYDARFLERFQEINSWQIGENWTVKENRMDYIFSQNTDYADLNGDIDTVAKKDRWIMDITTSNYKPVIKVCDETEYTRSMLTGLSLRYQDGTTAEIEIEMRFDESSFHVAGNPLYINYIKLTYKSSVDTAPQVVVKSACQ